MKSAYENLKGRECLEDEETDGIVKKRIFVSMG
jgi:hypothetical protein